MKKTVTTITEKFNAEGKLTERITVTEVTENVEGVPLPYYPPQPQPQIPPSIWGDKPKYFDQHTITPLSGNT